ncbi:hypothetical protein PCE1_001702 [Barthelona sp. PCE]
MTNWLINLLGVGYTLAWSLSFYAQPFLLFRRKRSDGLSKEFTHLNTLGFAGYTIYSFVNRSIDPMAVSVEDIVFATHALILCSITSFMAQYYPSHGNNMKGWSKLFIVISIILMPIVHFFMGYTKLISYLGILKAVISFIKYVPQAYMNFRRKKTCGWSIGNILLDITGAVLSFAQMFMTSIIYDTMKPFSNVPKLLLSLESFSFDILFITQHYCLYYDATMAAYKAEKYGCIGETSPLIVSISQ